MNSAPSRTDRVTRAAVEVLGLKGAAGLTHRAVDRHAGLPEGSTSNLFRTRDALVGAVCRFLTEHDLTTLAKAESRFDAVPITHADAAAELARIITRWSDQEAVLTAARLEIFLIARRDPRLAAQLDQVRRNFRDRAGEWLERLEPGAGRHAAFLMAVIEGLTANQLLHASNRMGGEEITSSLESTLRSVMTNA
ncbi:TetR/AcrR family transcriptional regulator [Erythrobacter sp. Dej080120_24]|uniref:TetR/AcrR family transcriptional regulator n=1 Tax=Erythrobacter sp. Dej080120_24 TaxID=3024837 RepID=UPI0030C6B794